ncbi:MAG TPA: hypothetical protein VF167_15855 [Longimicrobiaceae bacterium]
MDLRFKEFPPGLGHIKVPVTSRDAAIAALVLYAPCRPRAVWMSRAAHLFLRLFGAAAIPSRSVLWRPPMEPETWEGLCALWRREVADFDEVVVAERAQSTRTGFAALLLRNGRPRAFAKVRRGGLASLEAEQEVVSRVWRARPRSFAVPEPLGLGGYGDWNYLASAPLPSAAHRVPRRPPVREIVGEIADVLESLDRGAVPAHWRPMHGDLTPWNLREMPSGQLYLYDWEDAGWAPPGADEVFYRASAAVTGRETSWPTLPEEYHEAVAFWKARIPMRVGSHKRDRALDAAMMAALETMTQAGLGNGVPVGRVSR